MKATSKASEKILAPAGVHAARCIRVIDLGTQTEIFKGKGKPKETQKRMVQLAFELVDEKYVFSEEKGEESFVMYKDYTLSIGSKANLSKAITAWTGYKFTGAANEEFDMSSLLNAPCQLQVVHGVGKTSGKPYAIINAIMAPAKGVKTTKASYEVFMFSLDPSEFDAEKFESFPDWLQEKISATPEFNALTEGEPEEEEEVEEEEEIEETEEEAVELDDEELEEEYEAPKPVAKRPAAAPVKKVAAAVPTKKAAVQAPTKKVATAPSKVAVPTKKGKSDKLPF